MCYSGLCSFENCLGDCTAPRGFEDRYGVSPCMVGGGHGEPDEVRWAEEHSDEIKKARLIYWEDLRKKRDEVRRTL